VANDWKQPLHFVLGIADFLQDKAEELRQEILERGQEKGEDLREFVYDILENVPAVLRREPQKAEDEENPADVLAEDQGGLLNHYVVDDLKETVRDIMDGMGLATRTDVEDLNEKLDRLNQTVKNLIRE
jgi:polyhydroxyalkanoate synthesis regulator phasin